MKQRFALIFLFILTIVFGVPLYNVNGQPTYLHAEMLSGTSVPASCVDDPSIFLNTATNALYWCVAGTWTQTGSGVFQPLDTDLTQIAAISAAKGYMLYYTTQWAGLAPGAVGSLLGISSTSTPGYTGAGATGQYLAGSTGAIPSFATLNQAAVAGLTTVDTPTLAGLDIVPISSSGIVLRTKSLQSTAPLGTELVTNGTFDSDLSGWTAGANWSWSANKALHTATSAETLSQNILVTSGKYYQIEFTFVRSAGDIKLNIDGIYFINYGTIKTYSGSGTYKRTLIASGTGSKVFTITPSSTFAGSVDSITIKEVLGTFIQPNQIFLDDAGSISSEIRGNSSLNNLFIGKDSGKLTTTGYSNISVGNNSLYKNLIGYSNLAFGLNALYNNTEGFGNVAIGLNSLYSNVGGTNNFALGPDSLYNNIFGYYNIGIGNSSLFSNTHGYYNFAMGIFSQYTNSTGYFNIGVGARSLYANTTGYGNTGIGYLSFYGLKPTSKAITDFADYSATVPGTVLATSVGHGLAGTTTKQISGTYNYGGSYSVTVVDANTFYFTATWVTTETGWWAIDTEGRYNVAVGHQAGRTITIGDSNTFLGYNAGYHASQLVSAQNSMALGANTYTTASNQVVIGDTSITQTILRGTSLQQGVPTSVVADGTLENSQLNLWVNEANDTLNYKIKKSGGSVISSVIAQGGGSTGATVVPAGTVTLIINGVTYYLLYAAAP